MNHPEHILGKSIKLPLLQQIGLLYQDSASRVGWHAHEGFEVLLVLKGATTYEFKSGQTVVLHGGEFLVVPPQIVHRGEHEVRSPCRICGLALTPKLERSWKNTAFTSANLVHISKSLNQSSMVVHPLNGPLRQIVQNLMGEADAFWGQQDDAVTHASLRTLVCGALLEVVRQIHMPTHEPDYIATAAMAHLNDHYLESVSIEELSRFLGYSRTRTYELFKSQTGLTPKDYLQRLRVQKAEELLRQTQRSVTDIAHSVGFNSSQYFSTVFRRYTGQNPAAFRESNKNGKATGKSVTT